MNSSPTSETVELRRSFFSKAFRLTVSADSYKEKYGYTLVKMRQCMEVCHMGTLNTYASLFQQKKS